MKNGPSVIGRPISFREILLEAPKDIYRREFRDIVRALKPESILEIGCGRGGFLRSLEGWNGKFTGIDPDAECIAELKEQGFDAHVGAAERLAFESSAFDLAVFSYSAHHIGDWAVALNEAMRVARRAVAIIDPWHDETIPSQKVAGDYDRWGKAIDRLTGEVNNDWFDAASLARPFHGKPMQIGYAYRLVLADFDLAEVAADAEEQLAKVPNEAMRFRPVLEDIFARARRDGITDNGAIFATFVK